MIIQLLCHCALALISGRNQVDTFLEKHRSPGIQHIGLYTNDIVSTAHTMAEAGVQFFSPPFAYYTEVCLTLTELHNNLFTITNKLILM